MAPDDNKRDEMDPAELSDNIEMWKYNAVKRALLDAVAEDAEGVEISRLPEMVERRLSSNELIGIGSVEAFTTIVREDLEETGELEQAGEGRVRQPQDAT